MSLSEDAAAEDATEVDPDALEELDALDEADPDESEPEHPVRSASVSASIIAANAIDALLIFEDSVMSILSSY